MNRIIVSSDPGGARVLNYLYPEHFEENNWIHHLNFNKKICKSYDELCLGTSVSMEVEKYLLENAQMTSIIMVLDEVYNVKNRLNLLTKKLLNKISHIIYIEGTNESEIIPDIDHSFIKHPSLSMKFLKKDYIYDKDGPIILIDEYKESFNFIGTNTKHESAFLSSYFNKCTDLVYRSHPARMNTSVDNYCGKIVSGAIGYSTNYLIEMLKINIPTYSCADLNVDSILNNNSIRGSEIKVINGFIFNKLILEIHQ